MNTGGKTGFRIETWKGQAIQAFENAHLSVFDQALWRNRVGHTAGYREEVAIKDGVPVARLAYTLKRDSFVGISWGLCPPLSCRNGPTFREGLSPSEKAEALRQLLAHALRSSPLTSFVFTCDSTSADAGLVRQEFLRAGFQHSRPINPIRHPDQPSLMTPLPTDPPAVNKRRSHIRNARQKLDIVEDMSLDDFLAFYNENLRARGKTKSFLDSHLARALLAEGIAQQQVRLISARQKPRGPEDKSPPLDAAIAIALDQPPMQVPSFDSGSAGAAGRCYLLLLTYRPPTPAGSPNRPVVDANKVLIMEAADFAARHRLIFDTGGWATSGAERFYRQLFPGRHSEEYLDVFRHVKWHAAWYERNRDAFKDVMATHGISQIRPSLYNARIVWRKFVRPLFRRNAGSAADASS